MAADQVGRLGNASGDLSALFRCTVDSFWQTFPWAQTPGGVDGLFHHGDCGCADICRNYGRKPFHGNRTDVLPGAGSGHLFLRNFLYPGHGFGQLQHDQGNDPHGDHHGFAQDDLPDGRSSGNRPDQHYLFVSRQQLVCRSSALFLDSEYSRLHDHNFLPGCDDLFSLIFWRDVDRPAGKEPPFSLVDARSFCRRHRFGSDHSSQTLWGNAGRSLYLLRANCHGRNDSFA